MSNPTSITQVSPRKMKKFILRALYAQLVPFIQGSPGVGKSSIVWQIAEELNLYVIDHRLSTSAPEDMTGLPHFDKEGYAAFAPFRELFPLEGTPLPVRANGRAYDGWIIFLDEFNSATKLTMAAAYKLVLDRKVGQKRLHERCMLVCAGNLMTDRAIVNALSTAMKSRVINLELRCDFVEWLEDVALTENYDERIIAYLSQYPEKLMTFKPSLGDVTFECPRTWEFMNKLIQGEEVVDGDVPLYAGTISQGEAASFVQFCQIYKDMPNVADIMASPNSHPLPSTVGMKWAVVTALSGHADEQTLKDIATYVDRMDVSFRILFYRSVRVRNPDIHHHSSYTSALVQLARYLK